MSLKEIPGLIGATFWRWYEDDTFEMGAALAYYTVFSLGPVIYVAITVASLLFGEERARNQMMEEIGTTVGSRVAQAIENTIQVTQGAGSPGLAAVVSTLLLVLGATSVFAQLQASLNKIWGVRPKENRGLLGVVKDRFLSFTIVLAVGFLLLVSLVISTALAALSGSMVLDSQVMIRLWQGVNWLISFALITLLFSLIYKVLPDVQIAWRDVWMGGSVTALLFTLGKHLISLYLGQAAIGSAYGAAGSLLVVLLWVYYSSQLLLLGAEFTQVYACRTGRRIAPAENAVPLQEREPTPAMSH